MHRERLLCGFMLALWFLLSAAAAPSQEPAAAAAAATEAPRLDQEFARYFILRYDPEFLPLMDWLLLSSPTDELVHRAITACGVSDLASQIDLVKIVPVKQGLPDGTQLCSLRFACSDRVDPTVRADIWSALVEELLRVWARAQDDALSRRSNQDLETNRLLDEHLARTEALLDRALDEYIELEVATVTSSDALRKELQGTIASRRGVELNMTVLEARRKAMQQRIDALRQQNDAQIEDDEICQQLAQILSIRETALAHVKTLYQNGQTSAAEVSIAQEALARAKVELIRARQAQVASGVQEMQSLNEALAQSAINLAEQKVTLVESLRLVEELKSEFAEQLRAEKNLDRTRQRVELLQSRVRMLDKQRVELKFQDRPVQPVSVTPWVGHSTSNRDN